MATPITNQANVEYTYTGARTPENVPSNVSTINLQDEYSLIVTKNALLPTFTPGGQITYQIIINNDGLSAFTQETISDDLGGAGYLEYVPGSARYFFNGVSTAIAPTSDSPLEFTLPALGVGQSLVLSYVVNVASTIPFPVQAITNTVSVTGTGATGTTTETAQSTITLASYANVTLTKSSSSINVAPNVNFDYILTLENSGNLPATVNSVTDSLPVNFTISSVSLTQNGVTTVLQPTDYTIGTGNVFTLPSATGPTITVPAATTGGVGQTIVTISGQLS